MTLKTMVGQTLLVGFVLCTALAAPGQAQSPQIQRLHHSYVSDVRHSDTYRHRLSEDYAHENQLRHQKGPQAAHQYQLWAHNQKMDANQVNGWRRNRAADSAQEYKYIRQESKSHHRH